MSGIGILGTKKNPIKLNCAEIRTNDDKIKECIIKIAQRKLGLQDKVFKDKRCKYVAFIIKTNNCNFCSLGMNTCNVFKIVLPKKAIEEKVAVAV